MIGHLRNLRSPRRVERLRAIGTLILAVGIVVAAAFYIVSALRADVPLDTLPGYERAMRHGIGVQQGTLGLLLADWQQMLSQPGPEALLIVAGFGLAAGYCFRVAWVLEDADAAGDDRPADRPGGT
jgi:hypothetical protein